MQKKPTKPLKTLRLRKEVLKTLTPDELTRVQGGLEEKCCAYGGTALNSVSAAEP